MPLADRFSMSGRRALVTGASMSMGREIALAFAEAGADVAVHFASRIDEALGLGSAAGEVAAEIERLGRRAVLVDADLGETGAGRRAVEAAIAGLGAVDVLVVCASVQRWETFEEASEKAVALQVQVDFLATIELMQAALPGMKERHWGRVLTIGSINEKRPHEHLAVYAALKSAQANLAMGLAKRYAAHGVTVNNIAPGLVHTVRNRFRREDPDGWALIQQGANPMHRAGRPEEIAPAALLLCSEAGSFITGANLDIGGGAHL
ncbi:MAG: SDR family oxidoreductase [Alphaproteobacteria bacterium]|nr:SDR family oxidoreductase [Alphaproteobacteria bacterium]